MTTTPRATITPQLVIGLTIMIVGLLLTLDVAGVFDAREILRYWPVALIVIGALRIVLSPHSGGVTGGVLMIFLGSWLLLTTLHVLPSRSWRLFWPFILVIAGASLVMQTFRRSQIDRGDPSQTVSIFGVLGGGNRTSTANPFRGGDLFALMGGGRVDLRKAVIPPGEQATIEVCSMMGGFEIVVPETWAVDDRTTPVMGGISNETRIAPTERPPVLVLRGFLMMGGITIKN